MALILTLILTTLLLAWIIARILTPDPANEARIAIAGVAAWDAVAMFLFALAPWLNLSMNTLTTALIVVGWGIALCIAVQLIIPLALGVLETNGAGESAIAQWLDAGARLWRGVGPLLALVGIIVGTIEQTEPLMVAAIVLSLLGGVYLGYGSVTDAGTLDDMALLYGNTIRIFLALMLRGYYSDGVISVERAQEGGWLIINQVEDLPPAPWPRWVVARLAAFYLPHPQAEEAHA